MCNWIKFEFVFPEPGNRVNALLSIAMHRGARRGRPRFNQGCFMFSRAIRIGFGLLGLLCLSGCGGSGGGGGSDTNDPGLNQTRPPVPYAKYENQSAALHANWDAISFTDPASLPMSGHASYDGVIRMDVQKGASQVSLNGALNLSVNFRNEAISGSASGFVDQADRAYSGKLTVSNGVMDRAANPATDYTFQADLDGQLKGGGNNFDINAGLSGDFKGSQNDAVVGTVQGTATSAAGTGYLYGDFIGEQ